MVTTLKPTQTLRITGTGLITGAPFSVTIEQAKAGSGIVFQGPINEATHQPAWRIPAQLPYVMNTERGVTLVDPQTKQPLAIVEHFLGGCSLAGFTDLTVTLQGPPVDLPIQEMPLLDGSAQVWFEKLIETFGKPPSPTERPIELKAPVFYRHDEMVCLYALPADHFTVTYTLDYPHPDVQQQWTRWDVLEDGPEALAPARTFGFVNELPKLQAMGLARGVTVENTLGLTDDGGYTSDLRFEEEPLKHKIIDLIGDFTLAGFNPLQLKAHIVALNAGHTSHIAFVKQLLPQLMGV